ncbi:MAG: DUF4149 domain-containing protein [Pyrinomonadaceae bacterium]
MKFLSDIRLLLLAIWLGAAVFFIGVAQTAFAVLADREIAGAVVNRNLAILNYAGMAIAVLLIVSSLLGTANINRFWLWVERFLLLLVGITCGIGHFVIGFWLSSIRTQIGRPIEEVAVDDPLRVQFNMVHEYSVWVLFVGMIAALIAFFIIANRKFGPTSTKKADVYDFSKEFKV